MYEFKIVSQDKYMKRAVKIDNPHIQKIGKIDINDLHNSSFPNEIYHIGREDMDKLKKGKKVAVTVRTITTIYISSKTKKTI